MNKYFARMVLVLAVLFAGCGQSNKASQEDSRATMSKFQERMNYAKSLESVKDSEFAMGQIEELHANMIEVENLLANGNNTQLAATSTRAVDPATAAAGVAVVAFEVKTIPDRMKLGLTILEAIIHGSMDLKGKKHTHLTGFGLSIAMATADMINPLSDAKDQNAMLEELINNSKDMPDQKGQDIANIYKRAYLAKAIKKAKKVEVKDPNVEKAFLEIISKANRVRFHPLSTVCEINWAADQVDEAAKVAVANGNSGTPTWADSKCEAADGEKFKKDMGEVLTNATTGIKLGKNLKNLGKIFKQMSLGGAEGLVAMDALEIFKSMDLNALKPKAMILAMTARAAKLGSGEYNRRVQRTHTHLGFVVTKALIDAANPFISAEEAQAAVASIEKALEEMKNAPDMSEESVANTWVKEEMASKLREYRTYQYNEFAYKPKDQVKAFNKLILKATSVRLDPNAKLKDVDATLAKLEEEALKIQGIDESATLGQRANFWQKAKFLNLITKAFFTNKSALGSDKAKMDADIKQARKVHINYKATQGEVKTWTKKLENWLAKC